jgi:hypothetical protein
MRDWEVIAINAVMRHQQPPDTTLGKGVARVGGGGLHRLLHQRCYRAHAQPLKGWADNQSSLKFSDRDTQRWAGNLDNRRDKGARNDTEKRWAAYQALASDHRDLHCVPINDRNNAFFDEKDVFGCLIVVDKDLPRNKSNGR